MPGFYERTTLGLHVGRCTVSSGFGVTDQMRMLSLQDGQHESHDFCRLIEVMNSVFKSLILEAVNPCFESA